MENFSAINVSRKHKQFTSESAHANNQSVNMRLCLGIIEFKLFKYVPFQAKNSVKGISAYITNFKFTFLKPYVEAMVCVPAYCHLPKQQRQRNWIQRGTKVAP